MLTPAGNTYNHRNNLPAPGTIGTVVGLSTQNPYRKCLVESYPLCDGALYRGHHFSYGIHTCVVRFLDNGQRARFSALWFRPLDWAGCADVPQRKPLPEIARQHITRQRHQLATVAVAA